MIRLSGCDAQSGLLCQLKAPCSSQRGHLLLMRPPPCSFLPRSALQEPVGLLLSLRSGRHTGTTAEDATPPFPPHRLQSAWRSCRWGLATTLVSQCCLRRVKTQRCCPQIPHDVEVDVHPPVFGGQFQVFQFEKCLDYGRASSLVLSCHPTPPHPTWLVTPTLLTVVQSEIGWRGWRCWRGWRGSRRQPVDTSTEEPELNR